MRAVPRPRPARPSAGRFVTLGPPEPLDAVVRRAVGGGDGDGDGDGQLYAVSSPRTLLVRYREIWAALLGYRIRAGSESLHIHGA